MQNAGALVILTTIGVDADPLSIARTLVDERLAACVNVLPSMESVYRWQEKVTQDAERQLLIKTWPDRLEALMARLLALHPYETPELLVLDAGGSDAFLRWVRDSTRT